MSKTSSEGSGRTRPAWVAIEVDLPRTYADELPGWLSGLSAGAVVEPLPSSSDGVPFASVRIVLEPGRDVDVARQTVTEALERLAPGLGATPRLVEIPDDPWVERYQARLRPLPIGERFVVVPGRPGTPHEPDGRERIRLVPGRAFGTGEHETTRLCASELERRVSAGSRWLDLGCGSGILTVVAIRCGAVEVVAIDVDPDAVDVCREVVEQNGVSDRVSTIVGGPESLSGERFDGVVANVSEVFFKEEGAIEAARRLRPGGCLIASGFLSDDASAVQRSLEASGFTIVEARTLGEWRVATAIRGD